MRTPAGGAGVDTIVAISTPPGRGGIGIVRLAGAGALAVAEALVVLQRPLEAARAVFARVRDADGAGRTLDEAVVTAFLAPHSYTGDDLVEIAAHGSPVVLQAIVRQALAAGRRLGLAVRLAGPGEFTQRAFLAGRLDLAQAEAVGDLIAAQTLDQARVAAQQMGGALARQLAPAKEALLHLIALLEAGMDFASGELDDVDVVPPAQIAAAIDGVRQPLTALEGTFRRGQLLRQGAALALVGRPNAGKSSLFNRLLERERAIVTAIPGTTRDTLEEQVSLGGVPVRLVDTAGLRPGGAGVDAVEALGMARTREALADADLVLYIEDASVEDASPSEDARKTTAKASVLASLEGRPYIVVRNKIDLLEGRSAGGGIATGDGVGAGGGITIGGGIATSALTGEGLEALRAAILEALGAGGGLGAGAMLTNQRQHAALTQALAALGAAAAANADRMPHEVVLLDLHTALGALDALTGVTTPDEILARIFATFCIGK